MTTPQSSQQRVPCPSCGTMNPVNSQFCGNCGTEMQAAVAAAPGPAATPNPAYGSTVNQSGAFPQPTYGQQPAYGQQPNFGQQPNWSQPQGWTQQQGWSQQQGWNQGAFAPGAVAYAGFWIRFAAIFIDGLILSAVNYLTGGYITFFGGAIYYIVCWGTMSSTVGMKLFRLRVVDAVTMQNIDFKKAAIRYLGFIVNVFTLFIGFLMAAWDPRAQGLHDKIAGTVVIREQ